MNKPANGILNLLNKSHYSVVRNRNNDSPYLTREGPSGSRGIDHILCPNTKSFANAICAANIERDFGESFFPSDHFLISCNLCLQCDTLNSSSPNHLKNCYKKISSIKIKFNQEENKVYFDESQFETEEVRNQKKLFSEIQNCTNPDINDSSKVLLNELSSRTNALFSKIWKDSASQNKKRI